MVEELIRAAEPLDVHVESFVWTRLFGYDLAARHGRGLFGGWYYSQFDLPRMAEAGMAGAVLSVAANPWRRRGRRTSVLEGNLTRLRAAVERAGMVVAAGMATWTEARAGRRPACFLAVQGGNAFDEPADVARVVAATGGALSRVTLVHLTDSEVGATSSPLGRSRGRGGLTGHGRELVAALNEHRVLVDLAHASRPAFWDALTACDQASPPIVSHTGLSGVRRSWRNLDDDQVRAVAERGGVVGIMYHRGFLGRPSWRVSVGTVVDHLEHAVRVGGEEVAVLGSDWDGMIVPPRDFRTVAELPVLVGAMVDRGFSAERIGRILGENYRRVVGAVRPAA